MKIWMCTIILFYAGDRRKEIVYGNKNSSKVKGRILKHMKMFDRTKFYCELRGL